MRIAAHRRQHLLYAGSVREAPQIVRCGIKILQIPLLAINYRIPVGKVQQWIVVRKHFRAIRSNCADGISKNINASAIHTRRFTVEFIVSPPTTMPVLSLALPNELDTQCRCRLCAAELAQRSTAPVARSPCGHPRRSHATCPRL